MRTNTILSAILVSFAIAGCGGNTTPPETPVTTVLTKHSDAKPVRGFPNYNTSPLPADMTGMSMNAPALAVAMKAGYNIGNSLEASGGETGWGQPAITLQHIQMIKAAGFTTVRLPTAWNQYATQTTAKISDAWMARVKSIVQMCVDNGLYVIVNAHWDGGWLDSNITSTAQASVNAKQKAFWEQIATALRGYDQHVIFASANEPPVDTAAAMSILLSYHQTFVNAVRSTGGKNAYRTLIVQGPYTDIDKTDALMNTLPTDTVQGRMMAEVHYYAPYNFALMTEDATWGNMSYYWGAGYHSTTDVTRNSTWGEEDYMIAEFNKMKVKFVDKGIPVVMGEFGAMRRTGLTAPNDLQLHLNSRAYFHHTASKQAVAHGMVPVYWDNGYAGNNGFAVFDRVNYTVIDQQTINALVRGASGLPL